ncbi:hypothetical protein [Bacillus infantis]|uniref:hypothetical protein n=1 Tax=Bacillus infantis TaxID=324767 RepID=UPI003CF42B85
MKKLFTKSQAAVFGVVIGILLLLTSPFWLWQLAPDKTLEALIIDKTVPDETYREHKGLVWILNNGKWQRRNGEHYEVKSDYSGFKPLGEDEYKVKPLPENLEKYDVFYLADQYGVYEEEFFGSNSLGERSDSIYGGLQAEEADRLREALIHSEGKTLIAEFNTFADPTDDAAREKITSLLNISWSGWIGRYFPDLSSDEVPVWVKEQEKSWDYEGPGLVLVNKDNHIAVFGEEDLEGEGALFSYTDAGEKKLGAEGESRYSYWFDIVEANNQEEVLATYQLPLKKEAEKELEGYGIPSVIPAVIQHVNAKYSSYYFAGDFADEAEVPGIYQTKGLDVWKGKFSSRDSFYWNTYVPLMKTILERGTGLHNEQEKPEIAGQNGIKTNSRTGSEYIQVRKDGKWEDLLVKGVNMGIAKPGSFPGETAITKEEYLRWFRAIGAMNSNAVRVYTLHPPGFYEAFYEYNQTAEHPLYLFHGAWVNEENLVSEQNAYSRLVTDDFKTELKHMVDIVHGNASLPERPGHASGEYKYDISEYVLGFMIGIEWDPEAVLQTNAGNEGKGSFSGKYFQTENASPFEGWIARMMDYTAEYETGQYGWQHTMSFTNWVTTDLLDHPAEPSEDEDKAVVDPNHILPAEGFKAGMFASYHIYPYYPDFLNYEKKYVNYIDSQGEKNNYAGYLNDLKKVHSMPVLVAEFGVPASRGMTHENVDGMDQGHHSEEEQGKINKRLFESILDEGYAGGLVFTWQDEWFKRTWNTMDYDNPDRRPFWSNMQTNEQHFGLLAFEPGKYEAGIYPDGLTGDWDKLGAEPLFKSSQKEDALKALYAASNEEYLYLRLDYSRPLDWGRDSTYLMLDTIKGQGQSTVPLGNEAEAAADFGVDYSINLTGEDTSNMMVDSYYDTFYYQYGELLNMLPERPYAAQKDNGIFHPIRLALNKELTIPSTGKTLPFSSYETGKLMFGNANPESEDFNSLTDISLSDDRKTLELRIPWLLLNVKDPSSREIQGDLWKSGLSGSSIIESMTIGAAVTENGKLAGTAPAMTDGVIKEEDSFKYSWKSWEEPQYHERLKQSYWIMKDAFSKAAAGGGAK